MVNSNPVRVYRVVPLEPTVAALAPHAVPLYNALGAFVRAFEDGASGPPSERLLALCRGALDAAQAAILRERALRAPRLFAPPSGSPAPSAEDARGKTGLASDRTREPAPDCREPE